MPNWCFTNIEFIGNRRDVLTLYEKVNAWTSQEYIKSDFGKKWLGNVVIGAGLCEPEHINDSQIRCRGGITYLELCGGDRNSKELSVRIDTETAWAPMLQMWELILEKFDLDLNLIYSAEEPGNCIYATNDPLLKHHYVFDNYENVGNFETDWECSEYILIEILQDLLKTNEKDVRKLINMVDDSEYADKVCISEWEYVDPYEWE